MRFNEGAGLDTSEIRDLRGSGGGGVGGRVAVGGGGVSIVGLLLYFLMSQLGGTGGFGAGGFGLGDLGSGEQVNNSDLSSECRTGADANSNHDCAIVAIVNSVQDFWTNQFARSGQTYQKAPTTFFNGGVNTGCGSAGSDVGPFYCPADQGVYIDLSFYDTLEQQFGTQGGLFAEAYVLAHEYGHHVQTLLGTSQRVDHGATGPESGSVRLELQADCYAGVWAKNATSTPTERGEPLISEITQDDIRRALDTAAHIGDDFIQRELGGGQVDESKFSHGSSEQREHWFITGLESGDPARCDTFSARDLG